MKSFSQYFGEGVSCPEGTRWCTKCSKCLEVPCQDKEIKENNESKREQLLQKKQLMLNRQKLQLQMKQVQKKKQTDMYLNTEGVDRDKEGNDKYDRYKRMIRHKQGKYGVSTLKQRLKHGGVDYNIDNERKARNEDWQKKSGKNPEGGLNEKGRKSYERENPGSDLKAPSKKVGNPRRASFCARMKGMKRKLTSKKTASDPDSRINKSLRAWNC